MNSNYHYSGINLVSKVSPGERVLHIGYDKELFEGSVPNFQHVYDLEEYAKHNSAIKYNVAFCLEYINFGNATIIENQIRLLVSLLRQHDSRIYWRCNPGVQDYVEQQEIFAWSFEEHSRLSNKFGFDVEFQDWDDRQRIYAEWINQSKSRHYHSS